MIYHRGNFVTLLVCKVGSEDVGASFYNFVKICHVQSGRPRPHGPDLQCERPH